MKFEDKTALVTGAARGIGLAIVERLLGEGARVALVDRDPAVEDVAKQLGPQARALVADVTRSVEVDRCVAEAYRWADRLDVVVNNAGITGRSYPIWELGDADWEQVLAVDLSSVFYVCRAAVRLMRARRAGRIVNIASIAGKEGNPTLVPYSAAKAGVIGLTKALAKEVATQGILVHAVAPAVIGTELLQQMTKETVDMLVAKIPMGRVGTPAEVAALVAWLASDECTFTTGAVHDLSGGRATY
jgi:3-oxoacyl-[acyl-carrier protein] reductase